MRNSKRVLLALTIGDPAGVGPDISMRLLQRELGADVVVIGDRQALAKRAKELGCQFTLPAYDDSRRQSASLLHVDMGGSAIAGKPDPKHVQGIFDSLRLASEMSCAGTCSAVVTAPVSKAVIAQVCPKFSGHTEYFAQLTGAKLAVMAMVGPRIKVALVTTHLPLADVPDAITAERIYATLLLAEQGMRKVLNKVTVRWLVCGLNPHAGEKGMLGDEENRAIIPGLRRAREQGIELDGPVSADTAFLPERLRNYDCVLAMYHDQALPIVKRDAFASTVNVTFGLPFVRTSVDHGTAFELAARGTADPASLYAAFDLAVQMSLAR